jgi:thiosulfate/3-mercaptopyruvate sulfurtransferase
MSGAIAARLWWMLRWLGHEEVTVLDGGVQTWLEKGFPVDAVEPEYQPVVYSPAHKRNEWIVTVDEINGLLQSGAVLLDARSSERFRGIEEPIDLVAGHVPGATNFPFTEMLNSNGCFLPTEKLEEALSRVVGDRDISSIVAMCGSGVTACHLLLGIQAAGHGNGRLFVGSWSEWIRDPHREIASEVT